MFVTCYLFHLCSSLPWYEHLFNYLATCTPLHPHSHSLSLRISSLPFLLPLFIFLHIFTLSLCPPKPSLSHFFLPFILPIVHLSIPLFSAPCLPPSLYLHLSHFPLVPPSLSIYPFIHSLPSLLFIHLSITFSFLSIHPSLRPVLPSTLLSLHPFFTPYNTSFNSPSVRPSIH